MKKLLQSFLFLLVVSLPLFSLPPQKILYSDDWAYEALGILSREQKTVLMADSSLTVQQFERFLSEIDPESLSPAGGELYKRLKDYLNSDAALSYTSDYLSVGFDPVIQPELYFKNSKDVPWIYSAHSRHSLALLPVSLSLNKWVTMEMDIQVGQNEYAATLHDNYVNIPLEPVSQFDIHFPKRSYLSAGIPLGKASGISFAFGQGEDFFGQTHTGSIILSEYLERIIYAQLSLYSPALRYTAEVMQYEVNKYQYMHYLQVRPFKSFSISLAEGVMVNAPLELRFLNPFTIFHSYESYNTYTDYNDDTANGGDAGVADSTGASRIGSYFGAKLEWQPVKYLRLYGLFAMDQLQLGVEKDNWEEDLTPNAMAFQGGAELSLPGKNGYWIFGIEGVYTYPYMYVLWDKHWSFYKEVPEADRMTLRYWTGTPFGPDSVAGAFWAGFKSSSRWGLTFSFLISAQGERSGLDIFDHDNLPGDSYRPTHDVYDVTAPPTGIPVYTMTARVLGEWAPLSWLSFLAQPGYSFINNQGHEKGRSAQGFEIALSARLSLPPKQSLSIP
ncbi:MAG: hypothetical protein LBF78_14655 [Treponema sp.]|jgi:hypothetical protein|nr:hypothetical protein [Treponema sp.]